MFGKRQISTRADGARVTQTKKRQVVKYPNGDREETDKRTGHKTSWVLVNDDGTRKRDGR